MKIDKSIDYKIVEDGNKLYDIYKVILTGIEIYSIDDFVKFKESIEDPQNVLKILNKVNYKLQIDNLIEPLNLKFANFIIDINTNELKLEIRDTQIEFLIKMMANLKASYNLLKYEFNYNVDDQKNETLESQSPIIQEKKKSSFLKIYSQAGILK